MQQQCSLVLYFNWNGVWNWTEIWEHRSWAFIMSSTNVQGPKQVSATILASKLQFKQNTAQHVVRKYYSIRHVVQENWFFIARLKSYYNYPEHKIWFQYSIARLNFFIMHSVRLILNTVKNKICPKWVFNNLYLEIVTVVLCYHKNCKF